MRALRWHGRGDVRLDEVAPPPEPPFGEVQLAVGACGICGTDVEEWREGPFMIPTTPHPVTGASAPLVLGHELAGQVVASGDGGPFQPGDAVAVDGLVSCGACRECRRHLPNLCSAFGQVGLMRDGGLQPLVNVPASACLALPPGLDVEAGAIAETLGVGIRALRRGRLAPGERVAIVGAGAVGLLALQAARALGAREACVVEPVAGRRALALALGADQAVEPGTEVDLVRADLVVECSGSGPAVLDALRAAGPAGRVVLVGIGRGQPPLDVWQLVRHEKEILGSFSHVAGHDFRGALDLLDRGAVRWRELVTRIPLADALDEGLRALAERPADYLKIVVIPETVA